MSHSVTYVIQYNLSPTYIAVPDLDFNCNRISLRPGSHYFVLLNRSLMSHSVINATQCYLSQSYIAVADLDFNCNRISLGPGSHYFVLLNRSFISPNVTCRQATLPYQSLTAIVTALACDQAATISSY